MVTEIVLRREEIGYIVTALEHELRRLRRRLRRVEKELRGFEKRYGISTEEFMEMYERCRRGGGTWRLPEDADVDAVEWRGLALLRDEIAREVRSIEEILSKLRKVP